VQPITLIIATILGAKRRIHFGGEPLVLEAPRAEPHTQEILALTSAGTISDFRRFVCARRMLVLGISAFYHDSAAAIIRDRGERKKSIRFKALQVLHFASEFMAGHSRLCNAAHGAPNRACRRCARRAQPRSKIRIVLAEARSRNRKSQTVIRSGTLRPIT
jgi:hypothetical protein